MSLMMSSCCTLRLKRRRAFSIDSPSWTLISAKTCNTPRLSRFDGNPFSLRIGPGLGTVGVDARSVCVWVSSNYVDIQRYRNEAPAAAESGPDPAPRAGFTNFHARLHHGPARGKMPGLGRSARREDTVDLQPGTLYVVATPIGNLEDVTLRAVRVLREVALVACEDTRRTARLLQAHGIATPTTSFFEHNERWKGERILRALREGRDVALVSDAGTPGISDPGYRLVRDARAEAIPVVPVPGPSAAVSALSVSGLPTDRFLFVGFLPARTAARRQALQDLAAHPHTLVLYEAPTRVVAAL